MLTETEKRQYLEEAHRNSFNNLNLDKSEFLINGEEIKTHLDFKHHTLFKVHRAESSSTPFPMSKMNKITSTLLSSTIVLHDLKRKCNKRNFTLTEEVGSFLFIVKLNTSLSPKSWKSEDGKDSNNSDAIAEFNKQKEEEGEWISTHLKPIPYSSVKQAEIVSTNVQAYSWVEKEEVPVPIREVTDSGLLAYKPVFLRSKGNFRGEKYYYNNKDGSGEWRYGDSPKYLYTVVNTLEDVESGMSSSLADKMLICEVVTGMVPVLLSKSRRRYFDNSTHIEFSDKYFEELVSRRETVEKLTSTVDQVSIGKCTSDTRFKNLKNSLPELLGELLSLKSEVSQYHNTRFITDYVDIKKTDYRKELDKRFSSLINRYPLLGEVNFSSTWFDYSSTQIEEFKRYVKSVDSRFQEKAFSKFTKSKQLKIARLKKRFKK